MSKKSDNSQKYQRIQVFARCRPLNSIEKKQCSPSVVEVIPDKKIVVKDRNANREFLFDKVFPPDIKQISVYKAVVGPLIQEVLMGYNCTVFAYGQTGTGKTYTMEGERSNSNCSWEDDPGAGIIPRSLHQLFEDLNKEENVEFSVKISFLELYNEELFDLLSSTELSRLRLYEDPVKKGSVVIQGLEEILVNSKDEVYSILEKGTSRRQTAATLLNASSSRSHTVFSVTVHIKENTVEGEELLKTGKLNLVDLAGSENVGRSGAVDKRAREAGNINQSLLTLGRVITALIEKQPHVPYRESKLTRLLQDSLGGHTKTSIIATVSPAHCNFDETISTLDYATKAKSITINPEVNQKMTKRALMREYAEIIERLKKDLAALRNKDGFYIDHDNYTNLINDIEVKTEMIKDLSEKIEILKEENAKIEDMFKSTKEELCTANKKLNQTSQKYEQTAAKLSNTVNALNYTQKVLTKTSLERDENQLLVNVRANTEKALSQQAHQILHAADEIINDVSKLHAKVDRKDVVEKTNEEKCQEFRLLLQKQFTLLDDLVTSSEKEQEAKLFKIKEDIGNLAQSVQNYQQQTSTYFNQFIEMHVSNLNKLSARCSYEGNSQMKWAKTLLEDISSKEVDLSNQRSSFLTDLPKFVGKMNKMNFEMEQWFNTARELLCQRAENQKEALDKRSLQRKNLLNCIKSTLESFHNCNDEIIKDFKQQLLTVSCGQENLGKNFTDKLQEVMKTVTSLHNEFVECQAEQNKNVSKLNSTCERYQNNALKLKEMQEPLVFLFSSEDALTEDKAALNEISSTLDANEFLTKKESVLQSEQNVTSEFIRFSKEYETMEEKMFSETKAVLYNHYLSLSQSLESTKQSISESKSSLEAYVNSGKEALEKHIEKTQASICKTENTINESKKILNSDANKLKDEILKRDMEVEKFISEDLVKDIPTGTTPQRKNYYYPRVLVSTSPHERILQRYRSQLAANTEIAVNLPLDSSFNELDELKESPEYADKCSNVTDIHNVSFSSEDSAAGDTDSCASSVSDISVDGSKNKENRKHLMKTSRLPRKLPNTKVFIKPPPPSLRKPLVATNSSVLEESND